MSEAFEKLSELPKCRECGWPFVPLFKEHITCGICVKRNEDKRIETLREKLAKGPSREMLEVNLSDNFGVTPKCGFDTVDRPEHYNQGGIECLDAMKAAFGAENLKLYGRMNAFKYAWRSDYKNGDEDLRKAIFYLRVALGEDPRK